MTEVLSPAQKAGAELDAFVYNPGLIAMAGLFLRQELPAKRTERLHALQGLAAQHFDFRRGAERQATNWDSALLDQPESEQWTTIFSAAGQLGLVQNTEPRNRKPCSLVILGGANNSPMDRLRYGMGAVDDFDQVVYVGSSRVLPDAERKKVRHYAPNAQTEYDLGCAAFTTLLQAEPGIEISTRGNGDVWRTHCYEFDRNGDTKQGFVLSTPLTIGAHRATTYNNFQFFADRAELDPEEPHSVVSVTTGHYRQGQHFPAIQELTLPYGTDVETIGHSAAYSGVVRKPSQLLQETKAAIDAGVRLNRALQEHAA